MGAFLSSSCPEGIHCNGNVSVGELELNLVASEDRHGRTRHPARRGIVDRHGADHPGYVAGETLLILNHRPWKAPLDANDAQDLRQDRAGPHPRTRVASKDVPGVNTQTERLTWRAFSKRMHPDRVGNAVALPAHRDNAVP